LARFDKLEFDDPGDDASAPELQEEHVEKDEHYWANLADSHRKNGNYENALRFYSRSLEIQKRLIDAWVGQVQMLVLLGEYAQASMWAKKALEFFPSHGDLLAGRAQAEGRQGNQGEALSLSDSALGQRGETAYQWQVRGELMVMTKQKTDGHCFDKAQIVCSDDIVPLESGLIYIHHRVFVKAQMRLNTALEKNPDSYYAWYLTGICQQKTGMADAATRSFERCRELCPNHHDAGLRLAELNDGSWSIGRTLRRLVRRNR
jgi:tetratricopeptide (TPR) repeat protein